MKESTTKRSKEINKDGPGSYAEVHGLKMYYEIPVGIGTKGDTL